MAEFTQIQTYKIACPVCDSDRVVKVGFQKGTQRYLCRNCKKKFRANGMATGRRMDAEMMGSAIRDFYTGKSYKQIAEGLRDEYDIPEPSKATIYEWVRDYTDEASREMENHPAKTGDHWVADELMVDVGGEKVWLWNVMDGKTRYILASHLAKERDGKAATTVMRKALANADKPPDSIFTDKLRSYLPALREVLPNTKHYQSEGLTADINNNLSERLQGTYRDRIKTLRGLDSLETGQRYLDGWQITYNNFRGHESLHNDTPASRAKVNPPFTEWADVVKGDAVSPQLVSAETRLASVPQLKSDAKPEPKRETSQRSKRESVSRTPRPERLPATARPGKAATKVKGRTAKQHPAYKLRQRIRRSQRGGRR